MSTTAVEHIQATLLKHYPIVRAAHDVVESAIGHVVVEAMQLYVATRTVQDLCRLYEKHPHTMLAYQKALAVMGTQAWIVCKRIGHTTDLINKFKVGKTVARLPFEEHLQEYLPRVQADFRKQTRQPENEHTLDPCRFGNAHNVYITYVFLPRNDFDGPEYKEAADEAERNRHVYRSTDGFAERIQKVLFELFWKSTEQAIAAHDKPFEHKTEFDAMCATFKTPVCPHFDNYAHCPMTCDDCVPTEELREGIKTIQDAIEMEHIERHLVHPFGTEEEKHQRELSDLEASERRMTEQEDRMKKLEDRLQEEQESLMRRSIIVPKSVRVVPVAETTMDPTNHRKGPNDTISDRKQALMTRMHWLEARTDTLEFKQRMANVAFGR